jgi:hydroxypyruvate reductase
MAEKPDILVIHVSSPKLVPWLQEHFTVHQVPPGIDPVAFAKPIAPRIRGLLVSTFVGGKRPLIEALPNLEVVVNGGGHYDRTDVDAIVERGLPMGYTPGTSKGDVAEFTVALLIHLARRMAEADRFVRAGRWPSASMPFGESVNHRRVGILGMGRIGGVVAKRLAGFDNEIAYFGRGPKPGVPYRYIDSAVELARFADFLVLTCETSPATRHIVNAEVLAALGPEGSVVSVARDAIDEAALVEALKAKRIKGAALDVFEREPHVPDALLGMDNVVLTPHVASAANEAKDAMARLVVDNFVAHFAGKPLVTPIGDHH